MPERAPECKHPYQNILWIDGEVREFSPGIKAGVSVIRGISVTTESMPVRLFVNQILLESSAALKSTDWIASPRIEAMRRTYRMFGIDPDVFSPIVEVNVRRMMQGDSIEAINSVVDICSALSTSYQLPMNAFDLSQITPPLELRFSHNVEVQHSIDQIEPVLLPVRELICIDQARLICPKLRQIDSNVAKVTTDTKDVLVFVDGFEGLQKAELRLALEELSERIVDLCGGSIEILGVFP